MKNKLKISIFAMLLITGYSHGLQALWWGSNNTKKLTNDQKKKLNEAMMDDVAATMGENQTGADANTVAENDFSNIPADDPRRYQIIKLKDGTTRKIGRNMVMENMTPEERQNMMNGINQSNVPNTGVKSKGYKTPTLADQLFLEVRSLKSENRALTAENESLKQQFADLQNNSSAAE